LTNIPLSLRNLRAPRNAQLADDGRTLMTVRQVAALDCCSEKTVRRAITSGLLQAIRVGASGRLLRISQAAHRAYRQAAML
jgi:excisionase family DNA binding protein